MSFSTQSRSPHKFKSPGPYLAVVKNHLDTSYMGGLEVSLIKGFVDDTDKIAGQSVSVQYLSPFYGVTSVQYEGPDARAFSDAQKSYGFWMVPPDVGTQVLVIFVGGNYNQGYWIGCVQDRFQNYMVPGIASQDLPDTWLTSEQKRKYGTGLKNLPVAEFNKQGSLKDQQKYNIDLKNIPSIPKPIHPFADVLAQQGLLADDIRGVTSSSARREIPSMVFGISTPGPLDKSDTGKKGQIQYGGKAVSTPVSRLGGSTFVMDDGDENGDNELVRIRTRTGHQILLHNTEDIIYINNSQGTAWIELTSNGKIDIFAQDSVSIHSEQDFNLRADRNFNIEAGGNVNINANRNFQIDTGGDLNFRIDGKGAITSADTLYVNSVGALHLAGKQVFVSAQQEVGILGSPVKITGKSVEVIGIDAIKLGSKKIKNNDPNDQPTAAQVAVLYVADKLQRWNVPRTSEGAGWSNNQRFQAGYVNSIMQRVPMHEPWSEHESVDPIAFVPSATDNTVTGGSISQAGFNEPSVPPNLINQPATVPTAADIAKLKATDAITFTNSTGDAAHLARCTPELQKALLGAAMDFYIKTTRPMILTSSYRSYQEQKDLYNRWKAAGGNVKSKPKAAGLYTPVNPDDRTKWPSSHGLGTGFDTPDAAEMDRYGILKKHGLRRLPNFSQDPVHVYLINQPANVKAGE